MKGVAALYVRSDGPYVGMVGVDVWDRNRDANGYDRTDPVIAHPPCGAWGRYAHIYKGDDKQCAWFAVYHVRRVGGVLEHPKDSKLWKAAGLPRPGAPADLAGGYSIEVNQGWFGHPAPKATWLYLVGCDHRAVKPPIGFDPFASPTGRVEKLSRRDREITPPAFRDWLISLARSVRR